MPTARNGDTVLEYDTFGAEDDPVMLLIMGLGAQMTAWDVELCEQLAAAGYRVVRFDNRDVGLSSKTPGDPPDVMPLFIKALQGQDIGEVPYTLSDMADDACAVLDAVGAPTAHVIGASMGGMIAQMVAIEHPERVRSLTSIMSSTGDPSVGGASQEATAVLLSPPPTARDEVIEHGVKTWTVISGPLFDEARIRERIGAAYDRCFNPAGSAFQLVATLKTGDRTERLQQVDVPALVIHGAADSLVNVSGGEATAAAIKGSKLLVLDEMGHDMPVPLWPTYVTAITEHAAAADAR